MNHDDFIDLDLEELDEFRQHKRSATASASAYKVMSDISRRAVAIGQELRETLKPRIPPDLPPLDTITDPDTLQRRIADEMRGYDSGRGRASMFPLSILSRRVGLDVLDLYIEMYYSLDETYCVFRARGTDDAWIQNIANDYARFRRNFRFWRRQNLLTWSTTLVPDITYDGQVGRWRWLEHSPLVNLREP